MTTTTEKSPLELLNGGEREGFVCGSGGKDGEDCGFAISWMEEAGKEAAARAAPGGGVVTERVANVGCNGSLELYF